MRALATRIGKVPGWRVEGAGAGQGFKVYAPNGEFVTGIHLTPSDVRSDDIVLRTCAAAGFLDDEEKYLAREERERRRRVEAEQQKAVVAAAKAQKIAQSRISNRARAAGPFAAIEEFDVKWLLGKHLVPDVRGGIMTPQLADKLLEHNTQNRPRKNATVRLVKSALQSEDRWLLTHEAVALASDPIFILDGQNRLFAISETGIAAPLYVFVGMDPRTKFVIGQQSVRTAGDAMAMAGVADHNNMAAMVRTVRMYDKPFVAWGGFKMANDEVLDAYREDTEGFVKALHDAGNTIGSARKIKRFRVSKSTLAASIYLIRKAGNKRSLVDEYLEGLRTGAGLRENDPRASLVDWFAWVQMGKHPVARYEPFAMLILSWNGWVQGDAIRNLKWKQRHEFPVITVRK